MFGGWPTLNPWLAEQACLVRWCDLWWLVEAWLWLEWIKTFVPWGAGDLKREAAWVNCFKKNQWLRFPCWLSWTQHLTVPGGLQTFCSLSWSAINSPRHQMETWRRSWSCLNLSSSRCQVKEGVKLAVSGTRWRQWRRGWHNSLQRVSRIFRVRVTAELSFPVWSLTVLWKRT